MKSTRALLTFAFVADQFAKTNDIARGLAPLFAPLISKRAGAAFDPLQFANDVKATYDLELHPFVAEEFAVPLAAKGYLQAHRQESVVHYTNLHCEIPDPPINEQQLTELVSRFCSFSAPLLRLVGTRVSEGALQTAFLDRLVQPEFLALLLRPDRPSKDPKILTLRGKESGKGDEQPDIEQQLDFLVASYILNLSREHSDSFELIVAAASGALMSEVVLDLQHPLGETQPMFAINVAIDSPLVLDALSLGHEGATPYATKLIEQIQQAGGTPVVFEDTVEEIRGALKGPLHNFEQNRESYGPLGRRLRTNSAVAPYVRSIIPRIHDEIQELGVDVFTISPVDRVKNRTIFTEVHEEQLGNELGVYERDAARRHDARVIADVLRLRGGAHVIRVAESIAVFVTRNPRLVHRARQHLTEQGVMARDYFPPCISDRHLAGLLWISLGGGGESLSRLRLVANCSAAVMPRRQLVSRMHRFFEDLNPQMVTRFEALMTNERAEHFLMDRTLSDAAVITQGNYEEIYRHIEEAAAERVTQRKDEEIASLRRSHSQELKSFEGKVTRLGTEVRAAEQDMRILVVEREGLRDRLVQSEERWARQCLVRGRHVESLSRLAIASVLAVLATVAAVIDSRGLGSLVVIGTLTFGVTLAACMLGTRFWSASPLERRIALIRDAEVSRFARGHGIEHVLEDFELDWRAMEVRPRGQ